MALSVGVAALCTAPFAVARVPEVTAPDWGWLAVSAVLGVAVPGTVDALAGRVTSARVTGVLFAFDPALGAVVGLTVLGESLRLTALLGILLVVAAGALLVWFSGSPDAAAAGPTPAP
ncbi:EamA family transporter [Kocuria rhizophila]|uniref:EamA family transporter n=1 Tax=Kocuria rhizophila TaxID=72000 RepID=UPI0021B20C03|nr:EamA family transporter [Kocuria rhizophila]